MRVTATSTSMRRLRLLKALAATNPKSEVMRRPVMESRVVRKIGEGGGVVRAEVEEESDAAAAEEESEARIGAAASEAAENEAAGVGCAVRTADAECILACDEIANEASACR